MALLPKDPVAFRTMLAGEMQMHGRSQAALARRMGVHQSAVSRILSGDRKVKVEELAAIEDYLTSTGGKSYNAVYLYDENTVKDGVGRFKDMLDLIGDSFQSGAQISDLQPTLINNDYELVIRSAASLSLLLQTCVFATSTSTGDAELERLAKTAWYSAVDEKLEALVRVERLHAQEAARVRAILAVRDVMVHSTTRISLLEPRLSQRIAEIVGKPFDSDGSPVLARALFAVGFSSVALRLAEADPAAASRIFKDVIATLSS